MLSIYIVRIGFVTFTFIFIYERTFLPYVCAVLCSAVSDHSPQYEIFIFNKL